MDSFCHLTFLIFTKSFDTAKEYEVSTVLLLFIDQYQQQHEFLYWEFPSYQGQQAIRMGKWKGIRANIFKGNMKLALYNLELDPREEKDIADEHPEIIAQMEAILKAEHTPAQIERFKIKLLGD